MSSEKRHVIFGTATVLLMLFSIALIFTRLPIEKEMREAQKIFYFHVGSAWTMFIAFLVMAAAGGIYLVWGNPKADAIAGASAEIGFVYGTNVLITGSLWGRSAWNTWWNWEPRLTSMLVLWVIYAAYLLFRSTMQGETRRRYSSVFGILAFVMVPVVYYSIQLWGSLLHPPTTTVRELDADMFRGMVLSALAMFWLYLFLLRIRSGLEQMETEIRTLRQSRAE